MTPGGLRALAVRCFARPRSRAILNPSHAGERPGRWTWRPLPADWQWIFGAQLASVVATWALFKAVANFAGVAQFGRFGLMLAVAFGVNTLLFGPIAGWAQRHYQEAREGGALRSYYRALGLALGVGTTLGVGAPLSVAAAFPSIAGRVELSVADVAIALVLGIAISYSDTGVAVANAALQRRSAGVFLAVSATARVAAVAIAFALGARAAPAFGVAMTIGIAAILPLQVWGLIRSHPRMAGTAGMPRTGTFLSSFRAFALPLAVWGVPGYVLSFGDRLLLAYFANASVVGVYVAMTAATVGVGSSFGAAANRVLEPTIYAASGAATDPLRTRRAHRIIQRTTVVGVVAAIPFLLLYALAPRPIISLFSSSDYTAEARYLWLLFLATIMFLAGQQLMLHGLVLKRLWTYVVIRFVHAGVLAGALIVLVPAHGIGGVVYALLAAHALHLLMVGLVNRYGLGVPWRLGSGS